MHRVVVSVVAIVGSACVQKAPHATVVIAAERATASPAVLVLPTACRAAESRLCTPATWFGDTSRPGFAPPPASFAQVIDPALRLKLEFAGFTLAEAAAMRLVTADRVEVDGRVQIEERAEGSRTVADLPMEDVRAVASSLALTSVVVPQLTLHRVSLGEVRGELAVALIDLETLQPRWTVTCTETMYAGEETPNRLANCAGNGVLAVLAPQNVIGRAL